MKQYVMIGLGSFGKRILEELVFLDCEIVLIDRDRDLIDFYKNDVTAAYIADVINEEVVKRLVPPDIDAAVVDLGDKHETSILVTKYLDKLGVGRIIVKAETEQHGEILSIVGADHVILPNNEAAKRVIPLLASNLLFDYLPVSGGLVLAETRVPPELVGHSLLETEIRKTDGINVAAIRRTGLGDYQIFSPDYRFQEEDVMLVMGQEEDVSRFSGKDFRRQRRSLGSLFRDLFNKAGKDRRSGQS